MMVTLRQKRNGQFAPMQIAGYIASLFIGISLGLIGGGGSILTVPVLVYLFGVNPVLATSYSLFVVGSTSLIGAISSYRKNLVRVQVALLFGLSSIATVFLTRKFLLPLIPEHLFTIGGLVITHALVTMVLFAALMIMAARAMIKTSVAPSSTRPTKNDRLLTLLSYGVLVGLATGLLGAGGGFLLIPALVLFVGLPMKEAVGTSLLIIALNSLAGFTGDVGHFSINWLFLSLITLVAIAGILLGGFFGKQINGAKLKTGFGWFVLVMALFILLKEFLFGR